MPGVQEGYSINVSNRYELSIFGEDEDDNDSTAELDPIETLRLLEEQRKVDAELKKKAALKQKNTKKTHFKENKDSNKSVTPKNDDSGKDIKNRETNNNNKNRRNDREQRQGNNYGTDENRRPPRRRQENRRPPPREGAGFGENVGPGLTAEKTDAPNRFNRGDGDRRPERFRGGRGGGFRGGNRGNRFGGYRNDGRDDRGKREFDRRSGSDRSGVKPTDKRDGAGPHNWGTPEIEETAENAQGLDDSNYDPEKSPEKKEKTEDNGTDTEAKDEKSDDEPKEAEPVEMTLDEWKALQISNPNPKLTHDFKVRRPGEGENPDQWKGMKVIHQSRKDDDDKTESAKESVKPQNKQSTIPTNFRFGDNNMRPARGGGRGRGGRRGGGGGPRQYGNRDSYRNSHQAPPDVENEKEFPTLG